MRNLFDQYSQTENKLTHALVCCLHEDGVLLRDFAVWLSPHPVPTGKLRIVEQTLPGVAARENDDDTGNSLPDAWIFADEDESWALLIESKIQAGVDVVQLRKHQSMAECCGFLDATVFVVSAAKPPASLPAGVRPCRWSIVYEWFHARQTQSSWARRLIDYMQVLEAKMIESGDLTNGNLTSFSGIQFDEDHPYTPREAKRLLKHAMEEIKKSPRLCEIGVDPKLSGRGRIPENSVEVWDYVKLHGTEDSSPANERPHFTLGIRPEGALAVLILPNHWLSVGGRRHPLKMIGKSAFLDHVATVSKRIVDCLGSSPEARPWIVVQQRRALTGQRLNVWDAQLEFDPQTAVGLQSPDQASNALKIQPEWLSATYDALTNKNANIELCLGGRMEYQYPGVQSREFIDRVIDSWAACRPLLNALCP